VLHEAADVERLRGYTSVEESVVVCSSTLVNLRGLECLREIGGSLSVRPMVEADGAQCPGNPVLESLEGLEQLQRVGTVQLSELPRLRSLQGLGGLRQAGCLQLTDNHALSSFDGLGELETPVCLSLAGNGSITSLDFFRGVRTFDALSIARENLVSLDGLQDMVEVRRRLRLQNNPRLESLAALANLERIGGDLNVVGHSELRGLGGLEQLHSVGRELRVEDNASLTDLRGLQQLSLLSGDLSIRSNPALQTLRGLGPVVRVKDLRIVENAQLQTLDGLEQVVAADGVVQIRENQALTGLDGLSRLVRAYALRVETNAALSSLAGLASLAELGPEGLLVTNNASLESLALGALTDVQGDVTLSVNPELRQIDSLDRLELAPSITIMGNQSLSQCQIDALRAALSATSAGDEFIACDNLPDSCGSEDCPEYARAKGGWGGRHAAAWPGPARCCYWPPIKPTYWRICSRGDGGSEANSSPAASAARARRTHRVVAATSMMLPDAGSAKRTRTCSPLGHSSSVTTSRPPSEMSSLLPSIREPSDRVICTGVTYGARG
jgi:hypothetical protein